MKSKNIFEFDISPDHQLRLDQILSKELPEYSRSRIQKWIKDKKLLVNGQECLSKDKIKEVSKVEIEMNEDEEIDVSPEDIKLDIIYEDDTLLVVNKYSGMVTHTAVGNYSGTLQNALLYYDPRLRKLPRAGIIHRLDKQTSGALIVCKNLKSQLILSKLMQERRISKKYIAVVSGSLKSTLIIDKPIRRHRVNRKKMIVDENGKNAKTIIHSSIYKEHVSILDIEIITGRTHQIRVHLSDLGHPVLGDKLYGYKHSKLKKYGKLQQYMENFDGIALHAYYLKFKHPFDGKDIEIECLPGDAFNVIRSLALEK